MFLDARKRSIYLVGYRGSYMEITILRPRRSIVLMKRNRCCPQNELGQKLNFSSFDLASS